jgi:hypothetical protein
MRTVYIPCEVPKSFTLSECLSWIEVREYPVNSQDATSEGDFWYSYEYDGDFAPIDRTRPQKNFSLIYTPDFLYGDSLDDDDKTFLTECGIVVSSDDTTAARKQWEEKQEELKETAQMKLLLSLKSSALKAYGILTDYNPYEDDNFEKFIEDEKLSRFMYSDINNVTKENLTEIPATTWKMSGVEWMRSALGNQNKSGFYSHIRVFVDALFAVYPELPPQDFMGKNEGIEKRGSFLVSSDDNKLEISMHSKTKKPRKRVGRPPQYDWDNFKVELTRYILEKGGLPRLQKDLENHMLEWCQNTWENEPTLSAVRTAIQPYYKSSIYKIKEIEFA